MEESNRRPFKPVEGKQQSSITSGTTSNTQRIETDLSVSEIVTVATPEPDIPRQPVRSGASETVAAPDPNQPTDVSVIPFKQPKTQKVYF